MRNGVEKIYRLEKSTVALLSKIADLRSPMDIEDVKDSTLSINQGIIIAEGETNDWQKALSVFGAIYNDTNRTNIERIESATWASQMLVNLGRLKQADGILNGGSKLLSEINNNEIAQLLKARILEKRAWIADYRTNYQGGLDYLNEAKRIYESYGLDLPFEYEDSKSTVEHFLGRSNFGLGNFDKAKKHFETDLKRYEKFRANGEPRPFGEAFNYMWLSRCYALNDELEISKEFVEKSLPFFEEEAKRKESKAIMAHYYLLNAEISLLEAKPVEAVVFAEEALKIRMTELPKFPKGEIEALLILGVAYWQTGKLTNSPIFINKALEVAKHLR